MDSNYIIAIAFFAGFFLGKIFWKILTALLPIYFVWLWYSHGMPDMGTFIDIVWNQFFGAKKS